MSVSIFTRPKCSFFHNVNGLTLDSLLDTVQTANCRPQNSIESGDQTELRAFLLRLLTSSIVNQSHGWEAMYALSSSRWPGAMPLRAVVTSTRRLASSILHPRYSQARAASGSSTAKQQLEKRPVVSSFLYKYVREKGQLRAKIALFKRSAQVRTYQ